MTSLVLAAGYAAAALHFVFFACVVLGGFAAWWRPRLFWVHLGVAAYALGIVIVDWPCFLTEIENWSRAATGRAVMESGFIDFYLTGTLYPREHLMTSRVVIAAVVACSWAGAWWLARRRAARGREPFAVGGGG
ncbi:DUF2784 domain-containing protein [Nocardiopsis changdeensis]|uniref:DUF2784 domain-containing protein n=1 Tax=Nocardiopsis changdeensis TaxID=2831969 RepID=A0ABX8BT59_9ACTN|nr:MULTISPECIES: DUF2784 domain-containing protein [Nocardiopsis]QUX25442.1 DUF2784 domain-containing protein [Nocardiopsis changdeensis]QYX35828.1 DUF2784 domain-containing protein [Nocardiopsis sp. MT53]